MPKQILKIDQFHGGLNTNSDPRDIADNELSEATDVMVDELGKIRLMGGTTAHGTVQANTAAINPGYGLFQFSHDRLEGETAGADAAETGDDYLAMADAEGNADIDIYSKAADTWGTSKIDLGSTTGMKPAFYAADGALRVSDGNFGAANKTKWYGYVDRYFFGNGTTGYDQGDQNSQGDLVSEWVTVDAAPKSLPMKSFYGNGSVVHESGTHTGGDSDTVLTDSAASFTSTLVGATVNNITDGSSGIVVSVDSGTQLTLDDLTGGDDNSWDTADDDVYTITEPYYGTLPDSSSPFAIEIEGYSDNTQDLSAENPSTFDGDAQTALVTATLTGSHMVFKGRTAQDPKAITAFSNASPIVVTATGHGLPNTTSGKHWVYITGTTNYNGHHFVLRTGANTFTLPTAISYIEDDATGTVTQSIDLIMPDRFCSVGDRLMVKGIGGTVNSKEFGSLDQILTVSEIEADIDGDDFNPNKIKFSTETGGLDDPADGGEGSLYRFYLYNLTESSWYDADNPNWECAVSTLYDDSKQESPLHTLGNALSPDDICDRTNGYEKLRLHFYCFTDSSGAGGGADGLAQSHKRVSGFKVYMRREGTKDWYLQWEIDVSKGEITNPGIDTGDDAAADVGKGWQNDILIHAEAAHCKSAFLDAPRFIQTYESETGYNQNVQTVGFDGVTTGFKTAVVANRQAYVGNVRIDDWEVTGGVQTYGDAMLKSAVNKFDSFTLDRKIEASVNDGDEIVKLEEYADRILQFKKNKMHLINISQEVEFLEDTFMHKGVNSPAATCKTDFGIAWVNKLGVYLYDGQKVNNLFEKKGRLLIKPSIWAAWFDAGDEPIIGYSPKKRQLIIRQDTGADIDDGDVYLFDIVTQSWVIGIDNIPTGDDSAVVTNFINDWDGDLVIAHTSGTGTVVKWDDTSDASTLFALKTKDIDFGHPGVRKKVYKVIITYKCTGDTQVGVVYYTDGLAAENAFGYTTSINYADGTLDEPATNGSWDVAELKPNVSSAANNIKSIRLRVFTRTTETTPADFEINDISIVYRLKGVK